VKLLEKIKDIRDELHTLMVLFRDQETVIKEFEKILRLDNSRPKRILEQYMANIKKMDEHAIDTYNAVCSHPRTVAAPDSLQLNHLLDLKQKHANVQEARSSRRQADDTAKQGDTLLVFTLVTIIFVSSFLQLRHETYI
jgi:Mg2+ and Co2+ transporter CorA